MVEIKKKKGRGWKKEYEMKWQGYIHIFWKLSEVLEETKVLNK